jgi:hypothetical protein
MTALYLHLYFHYQYLLEIYLDSVRIIIIILYYYYTKPIYIRNA